MAEDPVVVLMRANMSSFQKKVWKFLGEGKNPWGFSPEVQSGDYLLDFFSEKHKVCIEADGPHHSLPSRKEPDLTREKKLLSKGIRTLHLTPAMFVRFSTKEILDYIRDFIELGTA